MAVQAVPAGAQVVAPRPNAAISQAVPRSSDSFHIPSLDGIRAAAVGVVFLAHAGLNDRIPGAFGVTAFFFLSGFLITTLLRMEFDRTGGVSLRAFYLRRALRIFPPMYLVLLAASGLAIGGFIEGSVTPGAFAAQALHWSNYYILQNGWWDGRAPGTWIYWSLAVEEHFYVIFPLAYLGLRRWVQSPTRQMLILLGACGVVMAWRLVLILALGASHDRTYVASDTRVDSILFGCMLAVFGNPVLDRTRIPASWWKWLLFPAGLLGLLVSFLITAPVFEDTVRYSLQGVCLIPLFVVAIRYPEWPIMRLLNLSWVRFVGVISYSIYLMHPTILFAVHQWTSWHPVLQGAVSLALTLGLATLMYHFVELPCGRLRKRLSRAFAPAVARAVQSV